MKRIVVLGSTGSIGRQTLDVARQFPDKLQIVGLAAGSNEQALRAQAAEFGVERIALFAPCDTAPSGMGALIDLATMDDVDCVVVSVAGVIGLEPTIAAIEAGKDIALASKETLVAAGEIVMPLVREHGTRLTPIDSEHSAIFQCLQGYSDDQVDKLILTASGGPFRKWTQQALADVTVEQALAHPTWSMGGKITIDSATLMNKALELIEAKWLFGVQLDQVEIVVHPQSVVHSMVKFIDGSVLGQMGWPNMRLPIQYALLYPERPESGLKPWSPIDTPELTFEAYDPAVFRGPDLARHAMQMGGTAPSAFNAANEAAVGAFLRGEMRFLEIQETVERVLMKHVAEAATLPSILKADATARREVQNLLPSLT